MIIVIVIYIVATLSGSVTAIVAKGVLGPGGIRLHYIENSMYLNIITSDMFSIGSQSNHNDLPYNMNVYWGQPEKSSHLFINVNLLTTFS